MAGAGYKLFTTGSVLTAADVNTYLAEQTVMVFADATARTAALSGVVSEGMISYLKDTNAVEVYNGSAWVASDDPNAIQNTIVDAKGDLITATAADTPARLAVGSDGSTLFADSSASTGLRWQSNFAAGKNKVLNGAFDIWQRGTSFTANGVYNADRFLQIWDGSGATKTITRETFTPGTAPVAGYEGQYFIRWNQSVAGTSGTYNILQQRIEDVRTFAGQTVTLSFWAKASASVSMDSAPQLNQNFGSGGSATTYPGFPESAPSLTTSWQRFSFTTTVPSVSGKTIGTSSFVEIGLMMPLNTTFTIDIWGVQLEAGNVATAFQTATGTLPGELAAAQRYYQRISNDGGNAYSFLTNYGMATTTGKVRVNYPFKVPMRIAPSTLDYSTLAITNDDGNVYAVSSATLDNTTTSNIASIAANTGSTITQYRPYFIGANNSASAYIGFSAEL